MLQGTYICMYVTVLITYYDAQLRELSEAEIELLVILLWYYAYLIDCIVH